MTQLLIVDEDKELSSMLLEYLGSEGFDVKAVYAACRLSSKLKNSNMMP